MEIQLTTCKYALATRICGNGNYGDSSYIPEFDPESESVNSYTARAIIYFKANSIPEDKLAAIFLSCAGAKTYDLLTNLIVPDTLDTDKLDSLFIALRDLFST